MRQVKLFLIRGFAIFAVILLGNAAILASSSAVEPLAPPNTHSPRSTVAEFVKQTNAAYKLLKDAHEESKQEGGWTHSQAVIEKGATAEELMERATRTLNLSEIPPANVERVGLESALILKEVLDRIALPPISKIPGRAEVEADETLVRWEIPRTEIALVKETEGKYAGEFLFSAETVGRLNEFYKEVQDLPYKVGASKGFYKFYIGTPGDLLPPKWYQWLPEWTTAIYLQQTLWQWFVFVFMGFSVSAAIIFVYRLQQRLIYNAALKKDRYIPFKKLFLPIAVWFLLGFVQYVVERINITGEVYQIFSLVNRSILFGVVTWLTFLAINAIAETIIASPQVANKGIDASLIHTIFRLLSVLASATVFYFGAERVGIPVAPLLASFGAVSLAIGVGAQEYFKNVVGGLTLFIDRPVSVGDLCEFGGIMGTIEEIGLGYTRIRTLERTLVSVPNASFSTSQLVNYSQRDCRLLRFTLSLRYQTTRQQLNAILAEVRDLLKNHPLVSDERVRFVGLGDYSLDLELFAYILTIDNAEFLENKEELLLKIMEIVERVGTDVAYPSQTVYISRDGHSRQQLSPSLPDREDYQ